MKHREYPTALKQAALARLGAGKSVAEVAQDLQFSTIPGTISADQPVLVFLSHSWGAVQRGLAVFAAN